MKTISKANVMPRNMRSYNSAYIGGRYKLYFEAAIDQILVIPQGHCAGDLAPTVALWGGAGVVKKKGCREGLREVGSITLFYLVFPECAAICPR